MAAAIELRRIVRRLVEHRIDGIRADTTELNTYLAAGSAHWRLEWRPRAAGPERHLVRAGRDTLAPLAPLAEAAAEFLARPDFSGVKRCGNPDCSMLFHDASATGRRRWCDMAVCGNRMKVAAFRGRTHKHPTKRGTARRPDPG